MENNTKEPVEVQTRRVPAPPGPFRRLERDYITLPKCKGHKDVLVVVDRFSRLVEAYPTKKGIAQHTAKILIREIIPFPGTIRFRPRHSFHRESVSAGSLSSEHRPATAQSSGQVECTNQVLKAASKGGMAWPDALTTVLCSIRATHNKNTGLNPFEVVTGRPMSLPGTLDLILFE